MLLKKYDFHIGAVFSAIISTLAGLPLILWFSEDSILSFIITGLYFFVYLMLLWFALHWLADHISLRERKHRLIYFLMGFILVFVAGGIVYACNVYLFNQSIMMLPNVPPERRIFLTLFRCFLIGMLECFFIFFLDVQKEKQEQALKIEHLNQAQLQVKLSSLKEQLSPHFLFNTLNTLSIIAQEDALKVFVNELSNVYRYVLQQQERNLVNVGDELNFVRSYLYIIKTRLEDAIEIHINVDKQIMAKQIPPLTLQLLLENAIKHNIATTGKPLRITLKNMGDDVLVLSNNYQPKKAVQESLGVGLNNVKERYQILFGKDITIDSLDNKFTVKLPLI